MTVESDGHSPGNPRMYELFAGTEQPDTEPPGTERPGVPKEGKSPTVWAFPQFVEFLKVAGQPVQGPWPPHQQRRPDPDGADELPVAVPDPEGR